MFSSPSPNTGGPPAKTPGGWARALGIFSTAKKPPPPTPSVEAGTNDTGGMDGEISGGTEDRFRSGASSSSGLNNNSVSPDDGPFMSPMNLSSDRGSEMTSNNNSNAVGTSSRPRLNFGDLSSRMSAAKGSSTAAASTQIVPAGGEQMALSNAKSPWQSRQNTAGGFSANLSVKSPWQGDRSRRSRTNNDAASKPLKFLASNARDRSRRYRPQAIGLVGGLVGGVTIGRRYRKSGECKPENISQALVQLKDSFLVPQGQDTSTNVYAVRGKVQWGSSDRPNRLPRPSQKRQRPLQEAAAEEEEADDHGGTSRKRRKKVTFGQGEDDGNAVVTKMSAAPVSTPFPNKRQYKGTPMPPRHQQSTPDSTGGSSISSPSSDIRANGPGTTKLPGAPQRRIPFSLGDLDSDVPISLQGLPNRESFDPAILNDEEKGMQFSFKKESQVTTEAARSFTAKSEYEATRYVRPPSPERNSKKKPLESDDETKIEQSAKKRTKVSGEQDAAGKVVPPAAEGWGGIFDNINKGWKCQVCTVFNDLKATKCQACDAEKGAPPDIKLEEGGGKSPAAAKPAMPATTTFPASFGASSSKSTFQFGSATPSLPVPSGKKEESKFEFPSAGGTNGSTSTGGFTFGTTPAAAPSASTTTGGKFVFTAPPAAAPGTGFVFGGDKKDSGAASSGSGFVFGGDKKDSGAASSGSGFVFGGDKKENGGDEKKAPSGGFQFGTPAASAPAPAPQTGFQFGATNSASSGDAKTPAPATKAPAPSTEGKKPFAPFSASSGENRDKKPAASSAGFGNTASSAPTASAFGAAPQGPKPAASTPAAAPAPPPFSFSEPKATPAAAPTGGFSFGGAKSETKPSAPGGADFKFGGTPAPAPAPAPKTDKKPKRQRGYDLNGTKSAEPKASKPAPTMFGAPAPAPAAAGSGAPVFSFGGNKTDGTASNATGSAPAPSVSFGNSAPAAGGMQFGSTQAPAAPAPAAAQKPFVFGASTPAPPPPASTAPTPAAPMFGGGAGAPAFGGTPAPSATGAAPATTFGGPPAPAPSVNFGAPAPGGFGAAAPSGFGSGQPPAAPAFGSAPAAPAPAFGSTPAAPAPAFGSTPAAPAPAFGSTPAAPAPAAFGSTTAAPAPAAFGSAPGGFSFGGSSGFAANPPAATPGAPAFGNAPSTGGFPGFGNPPAQTPSAPSQGFTPGAFGNNAPPNTGGFGGATPAPTGGFGGTGFGAPQTGGFASTTTPAPSGGFGGFGGAPQTAPPQGAGGFSMGTSGPKSKTAGRRRIVKARRPTAG